MANNNLLTPERSLKQKILYIARHAPCTRSGRLSMSESKDGGYPRYHHEIFQVMKTIGYNVFSSPRVDEIFAKDIKYDYVFSLFNRGKMRNSEIFISAICEYLRVKYLGSSPNIRAIAEDKYLTKLLARQIGIPTTEGIKVDNANEIPKNPSFLGPWFVKPRFGAASAGISDKSTNQCWDGIKKHAEYIQKKYMDVLIEKFVDGINVTVPIIGGAQPIVLPAVRLLSSNKYEILSENQKKQSKQTMSFIPIENSKIKNSCEKNSLMLYNTIKPIDYMRVDFRVPLDTEMPSLIEFNVCCDISSFGSLMYSAGLAGYSQTEIVGHVLEYSLMRQKNLRKHLNGIL